MISEASTSGSSIQNILFFSERELPSSSILLSPKITLDQINRYINLFLWSSKTLLIFVLLLQTNVSLDFIIQKYWSSIYHHWLINKQLGSSLGWLDHSWYICLYKLQRFRSRHFELNLWTKLQGEINGDMQISGCNLEMTHRWKIGALVTKNGANLTQTMVSYVNWYKDHLF